MRLVPVDSSAVSRVGYDPAKRLLAVEYTGGGLYEYAKVTPAEWEGLLDSESIGRYVNYVIKPVHPFRVVAPRTGPRSRRPSSPGTATTPGAPRPARGRRAPPRP